MKQVFFAVLSAATILLAAQGAKAQTNLQVFYDLGSDRQCVTTTLEGFYNDNWGNTFFFVDHDYPVSKDQNDHINGTYWEIARCFNFWQDSPLNFLSLQLEYNGGAYRGYDIKHAYLAGLDFFLHSADFRNTFNFKLLYKYIANGQKNVPLQFTFVWGMQDLFGLKGLRFSGFADFWGERHTLIADHKGAIYRTESSFVFISEPQLWYNVGQHFGVQNLNIGGELELSYDFGSSKGFWARPCLGVKWVF